MTRRPRAFATGADLWCYPGGETGQVDCRYAAYEPPSRPLKTLQQRKIKARRNRWRDNAARRKVPPRERSTRSVLS